LQLATYDFIIEPALEIDIEIGLKFNQSKERKPISSLMNFALIGQNPISILISSLIWASEQC